MVTQLIFDFIEVMDCEAAEEAEHQRIIRQKQNADARLKHMVDDLPPVGAEIDVMMMGIRMCRHVHEDECHKCNLDTQNHCPDTLPAQEDRYWLLEQFNTLVQAFEESEEDTKKRDVLVTATLFTMGRVWERYYTPLNKK